MMIYLLVLCQRREVGHEIVIEDDGKSPNRTLFSFSLEQLKNAKEYVDFLVKKKKI